MGMYDDVDPIAHYGVKGMKWGVRHDKPSSGGLKKRASGAVSKAVTPSSERKKKLVEYYKKQGYIERDAKAKAEARAKAERVALIAGGITLGTAATIAGVYFGRKAFVANVDTWIRAGTKLQNLNSHNPKEMQQAFYATLKRSDKNLYKGTYARNLLYKGEVFNTTIKTDRIKLASERTGRKMLENLMKNDKDFSRNVKEVIDSSAKAVGGAHLSPKRSALYKKASADLAEGKISKNVYDAFNIYLVDRKTPYATAVNSKFYNALKSKGYGAIRDRNDMKYSVFKAQAPTIFFDTAKTHVAKSRTLPYEEIRKYANKYENSQLRKSEFKATLPVVGLSLVTPAAAAVANSKAKKEYVQKYRRQHPDSNLSYQQVVDLYNKKKEWDRMHGK